MPLFQKTVLKEFVARQNQEHIQEAYTKFQAHFGNADIQKNITAAKEEQYQEGFLKDLFVDILGYTLNPQPNFNLTTEQKNETDSKKADAAILQTKDAQQQVVGIIELKSAKTILLQSVEYQAFGYKNHHQNCRYVITSNFTKLRFYLDNAIEFEEFDLFALTLPQFAVLYTLLHCKNLLAELPIKLKQQSIEREEELTLSFYNDYENFKDVLFLDISQKNRQIDKFTLFQKTQKLLDRIVFICFAEDKGLLPSNLIKKIVTEWENLRDYNEYKPLYAIFLKHFGYINNGFKNKLYDIFGYNGGLFAEDEILSQLQITDELLMNQCNYLSRYDFDSDIDVNVLGHIFEHSLNQLDAKRKELIETAQKIELGEKPKENGKRKIDGIFYTPAYITAYMVQETVGKLCEEKKVELGLINTQIDFENEEAKEAQSTKLQSYETWLTTIRVLDPACGSGAFLNQVLTFFIAEYAWLGAAKNALLPPKIEEKIEKKPKKVELDIFAAPVPIEVKIIKEEKNIIHQILENNIFGVDLNEESVEITKLSLWLKTASMRQKLNNLTDNIKCGNSLIDDKAISEKAFEWVKEFPKAAQGFTVVVGNPPYVDIKTMSENLVKHYFEKYETAENRINLYALFIEKGYSLLHSQGVLSFIVPNSLLVNSSYLKVRTLIYKGIQKVVKMPDNVFKDANVETVVFTTKKDAILAQAQAYIYERTAKIEKMEIQATDYQVFDKINWNGKGLTFNIYADNNTQQLIRKCYENSIMLDEVCEFSLGITPYDRYKGHTTELIENREFHAEKPLDETYKPTISGENITSYFISEEVKEYIKYGNWLGAKRDERFFTNPRIIVRQIISGKPPKIYAGFTDKPLYFTQIGFALLTKENFDILYILAIFNSKLLNFIHKFKFLDIEKEVFQKILIENCKKFPIKAISISEQKPFIEKVTQILLLNKELKTLQSKYLKFLEQKFPAIKISKKLTEWYLFSERDLLVELEKQKITIPMKEHYEFYDFFSAEQKNAKSVLSQTQSLENQIDNLVYALYDLSVEEIKIVEM
jgi:tRNA1(Val) A37 N6-methylase TrmN6